MIVLRPLQQQSVTQIRDAFRRHRSVLFVAATGYGKTVLFSFIARQMYQRRRRVVILVHRDELIHQVSATLAAFGVPHGVLAPSFPYTDDSVQVASVFTLARRVAYIPEPYLVVIDEAHHAVPNTTWGKILTLWHGAYRLGVTATPIRLSGEGLGDLFDELVQGPQTQQLIDAKLLAPLRIFAPQLIDTAGIPLRRGDYDQAEVRRRSEGITGDVVQHYLRHANGRRAIAFCVSVEHGRQLADEFNRAGAPGMARAVWGAAGVRESRAAISALRAGSLRVLTSCDLISEGLDCGPVECGILCRPTASTGLYLQQVGRCLRTSDGKRDAVILDHAGNTLRHGWPAASREWILTHSKTKARDLEAPHPGVRVCGSCFAATPSPASTCSNCGRPFPVTPRKVRRHRGELDELTAADLEAEIARLAGAAARRSKEIEFMTRLGIQRGYHPINARRWAEKVVEGRDRKRTRSHKIGAAE